jgi:hypothetical protein
VQSVQLSRAAAGIIHGESTDTGDCRTSDGQHTGSERQRETHIWMLPVLNRAFLRAVLDQDV